MIFHLCFPILIEVCRIYLYSAQLDVVVQIKLHYLSIQLTLWGFLDMTSYFLWEWGEMLCTPAKRWCKRWCKRVISIFTRHKQRYKNNNKKHREGLDAGFDFGVLNSLKLNLLLTRIGQSCCSEPRFCKMVLGSIFCHPEGVFCLGKRSARLQCGTEDPAEHR